MKSGLHRVMKMFCKTTTLHGFKYLASPFCKDRVGWVVWSCASACCAGVLCAVLWTRFLQSPMLLTRRALLTHKDTHQLAPLVAICRSPYQAAHMLTDALSININETKWLPVLFSNILRGKFGKDDHRVLLDQLLFDHNITFSNSLMGLKTLKSPCKQLMKKCRWQNKMVPCNQLFDNELTRWGACCIMRAEKLLSMSNSAADYLETTEKLDLMMDCYVTRNFDSYCCELFVKYHGEDWLGPWYLMSGYSYNAQLVFTSIQDPVKEKLVHGSCVTTPKYSHSRCMVSCRETECGCSHPLHLESELQALPPICTIVQMKCLGNFIQSNRSKCDCLHPCQRITAYLSIESYPFDTFNRSFNPIYNNVNSNTSIVLNIRIKMRGSKSYDLIPTETWFTLLSSFGGVFNMFLGIGLFTALECLYFLLVRWPLSIKRTSEMIAPIENLYI